MKNTAWGDSCTFLLQQIFLCGTEYYTFCLLFLIKPNPCFISIIDGYLSAISSSLSLLSSPSSWTSGMWSTPSSAESLAHVLYKATNSAKHMYSNSSGREAYLSREDVQKMFSSALTICSRSLCGLRMQTRFSFGTVFTNITFLLALFNGKDSSLIIASWALTSLLFKNA